MSEKIIRRPVDISVEGYPREDGSGDYNIYIVIYACGVEIKSEPVDERYDEAYTTLNDLFKTMEPSEAKLSWEEFQDDYWR